MGVKVKILPSAWAKAVEHQFRLDIIGKTFMAEYVDGDVYVIDVMTYGRCYLTLGYEIEIVKKEEIFTDKEYEELWV